MDKDNIFASVASDELELLEFSVGDDNYGINIAKVNEIMTNEKVTPVPNTDPAIEGIFIPRDKLITVVDLHKVLGAETPTVGKTVFVVCSFNDVSVAFHVSKVRGFQRIPYNSISKPPAVMGKKAITGVAKIEDRVIIMLDFEKIVNDLSGGSLYDTSSGLRISRDLENKEIILADDSPFLSDLLSDMVSGLGFRNIHSFHNGEEAWEHIKSVPGADIGCVVTDIEMPVTDGLRLTERIKKLDKDIPVIIFSSLSDEPTRKRCSSSGADAQFGKHETMMLSKKLIELVGKRR